MKLLFSLFLFAALSGPVIGQSTTDSAVTVIKPDKFPEFKSGLQGWSTFLERNLDRDLPTKNNAPTGVLRVVASFLVGVDGSVSDIIIETDPGYGTANEVKRVLRLTDKRWLPATKDGKPLVYRTKQSISFLIN